MSSYINKLLLTFFLITLSSVTHASLITNGSFEQMNSSSCGKVFSTYLSDFENKGSVWDIFLTLPDWRTTLGNGIELQKMLSQIRKMGHIMLN
jgi:hypothetical protein